MKKVLVVSAVNDEILSFRGNKLITGIGHSNAIRALTKALIDLGEEDRKDLIVINVGTVGSKDFEVGTLIDVKKSIDPVHIFLKEDSPRIYNNIPEILVEHFQVEQASCLSVSEFVSGDTLIENIRPYVIDMELSAITDLCKSFNVELRSIKIVSDNLDSSLEDWWNIISLLSTKLVDFLNKYIEAI